MSIKVVAAVWDRSKASGSDLLAMLYIADRCNDDGSGAYPSISKIARAIRLSERSAQYIIQGLVAMGELTVEKSAGPRGVNLYRINLVCDRGEAHFTPGEAHCTPLEGEGVKPIAPGGVKPIAPNTSVDTTVKTDPKGSGEEIEKTKPLPLNGDAQKVVAEYCRLAKIDQPASYARAVGQAQRLVNVGVTVLDIPSLFEAASWGDGADLDKMLRQVDRWRAAKNAPSRASPNGIVRFSLEEEREARRNNPLLKGSDE